MEQALIDQHDELLAYIPEGENHDEAQCPICVYKNNNEPEERGDMEKEFSQDELNAAVKAAVAPLQAEIDRFKEESADAEVEERIAAAVAEVESKVEEANAARDAAEAEAAAAKKELEELIELLTSAERAAEEAARIEAIKAERADRVKEATSFTEEKIAARIDEWAALSDEDFDARIAEWADLTASIKATVGESVETASSEPLIKSVRDEAAAVQTSGFAAYREIKGSLAQQGVR